jgi:hypothetical protein
MRLNDCCFTLGVVYSRAMAGLFASAYSVKAAKTKMPINVATATAIRARKNLVI